MSAQPDYQRPELRVVQDDFPGGGDGPKTLDALLAEYLEVSVRISSYQSGRRYRTTVNNLTRFLGRPATVADLTPQTYSAWARARRDAVSPNTVRGDCEKLLVLWKYAFEEGLVSERPRVALPQKQQHTPSTYTEAEVKRIWATATKCQWLIGQIPGGVFWPALISVLYQTAERIQAVHALTAADIDFENGVVRFRAETRKGSDSDCVRPIDKECAQRLRELLRFSHDRPFAAVKLKTLYPAYRRLLFEAGVSANRRKMFHAWRRRHASDLDRVGLDATVALGHSSRAITMRSYIDPAVSMTRVPLRKLIRLGRGSWLGRLFGRGRPK